MAGYTLPFTPTGRSSAVMPPPWHFSGECLAIEFTADAERIRPLVPPTLASSVDGTALATFCEWQSCSAEGGELNDPFRSQFKELFILVGCALDGQAVTYCPFMWVDQTFSILRGWFQGLPKKEGAIAMSRPVTVGRAGPRLAPGGRFAARASAEHRLLAEAACELEAPGDAIPELFGRRMVARRLVPEWVEGTGVDELIASQISGSESADIWTGSATLAFHDAPYDELRLLEPTSVGRGTWFSYAETLERGVRVDG